MGRHIDKTPLLYSVGTKLAYRINKRYYKDVHYVWCADSFNSKDQPPTSNPCTIIKRYLEQISSGDRHTKEIDNNVAGILKGAKAKLDAGVINKKQYTAIRKIVSSSDYRAFFLCCILLKPVKYDINAKLFRLKIGLVTNLLSTKLPALKKVNIR